MFYQQKKLHSRHFVKGHVMKGANLRNALTRLAKCDALSISLSFVAVNQRHKLTRLA